jgi:hypothetical protein
MRQEFGRYADTVINDPDAGLAGFFLEYQGNMAAGFGIFGGIDQQVGNDLLNAGCIAPDQYPLIR